MSLLFSLSFDQKVSCKNRFFKLFATQPARVS